MRLADLTLDLTALGPFKQIQPAALFSNSGEDATAKDAYRHKEAAEFVSVQHSLLAERLFKTKVPDPKLVQGICNLVDSCWRGLNLSYPAKIDRS